MQAPRSSTPVIRPVTPPAPSPPPVRLELISVEERGRSPRNSRVSITGGKGRERHRSRSGEEVYIERERDVVRLPVVQPEYETYRYVEAPGADYSSIPSRRRTRSITYETNPRHSGRVVERERVVIEDGGRRREYYRKP